MFPNAWDCIYSKETWHQRKHLGPWGGARRLENPGGSSLIVFKIGWDSQGGSQESKGQRGAGESPWREGTWPSQEVCRSLGMEKGYTLKNVDSLWNQTQLTARMWRPQSYRHQGFEFCQGTELVKKCTVPQSVSKGAEHAHILITMQSDLGGTPEPQNRKRRHVCSFPGCITARLLQQQWETNKMWRRDRLGAAPNKNLQMEMTMVDT